MPSILVHERLMANDQLTGDIKVPEEGSVLPDSCAFDKGEPRAAADGSLEDVVCLVSVGRSGVIKSA